MKGCYAAFSLSFVVALSTVAPVSAGLLYIDPLFGYTKTTVQYTVGNTQAGPVALLADIYQPIDIGNGAPPLNRPALVGQDGGAWTSAKRTAGRVVEPAIYAAQRGYTVVMTDYRQGAPGNALLGVDPGPHAPVTIGNTVYGNVPYNGLTTSGHTYAIYPGMTPISAGIEDFAVAIAWTRSNALSLGIDPNRIGALGGSAGGIDALLLQYNNNPVNPDYTAQAVVALVSTMMNNYNRIQPGGSPVFLLNNTADAVVPWSPQMSQRFVDVGIYREQWFQPANIAYHDVEWDLDLGGLTLMERMRDFLAFQLAGGPVVFNVPEPSTFALALVGILTLPILYRRKKSAAAASALRS